MVGHIDDVNHRKKFDCFCLVFDSVDRKHIYDVV